ncbi:MAG: DUF1905 domain-containing protein [Chloroflexi bacterium]|nr:DUF1905 domain-containing protein [Chloroflexota bacterium]
MQEAFGTKGRVPVKGTPFRGSLMAEGDGTHFLVVNKTLQQAAKATQDDTVEVEVELDTAPRVVEVPEDISQALASRLEASERFAKMPYSHQKEYVNWINSSKRAETRARRIEQAVSMISGGKWLKG